MGCHILSSFPIGEDGFGELQVSCISRLRLVAFAPRFVSLYTQISFLSLHLIQFLQLIFNKTGDSLTFA